MLGMTRCSSVIQATIKIAQDKLQEKTTLNEAHATIIRRIPKRGFNNHFRKVYSIVNLSVLEGFDANSVVDMEVLNEKGLIKMVKDSVGLKVLGNGTLSKALTVKAAKFSDSAKEAIEKAGGKAEQI